MATTRTLTKAASAYTLAVKVPIADLSASPTVSEILGKVRVCINQEEGYQNAKNDIVAQKANLDALKAKALALPS